MTHRPEKDLVEDLEVLINKYSAEMYSASILGILDLVKSLMLNQLISNPSVAYKGGYSFTEEINRIIEAE